MVMSDTINLGRTVQPQNTHFVIIDDDPVLSNTLAKQVHKIATASENVAKFTITEYTRIEDYFSAFKSGSQPLPSILFLDRDLGDAKSSFLDVDSILAMDELMQMKIIAITADTSNSARAEAYGMGIHEFLTKPIEWVELSCKVNAQLANLVLRSQIKQDKVDFRSRLKESRFANSRTASLLLTMDKVITATSVGSLASLVISNCEAQGAKAALYAFPEKGPALFYASENIDKSYVTLLDEADRNKRLTSIGDTLIISYPHLHLLVGPLPNNDLDKSGFIEYLDFTTKAIDAKLKSLHIAFEAMMGRKKLVDISMFSRATLDELKKRYQINIKLGLQTLTDLLEDINEAYLTLGLTDEQESLITSAIESKVNSLIKHNDNAFELLAVFDELISKLDKS